MSQHEMTSVAMNASPRMHLTRASAGDLVERESEARLRDLGLACCLIKGAQVNNDAYRLTIRERDGTERVVNAEVLTWDPDPWHGFHHLRRLDLPERPLVLIRARSVVEATPAAS
jgi:hypothetical protein